MFELKAYQRVLNDIKKAGAQLIAVSPQTPDASLTTKEKNELEFLVLSDASGVCGLTAINCAPAFLYH